RPALAKELQKGLGARKEPHMLAHLAFELRDIERQLARPVVDAVPVERAAIRGEPRRQLLMAALEWDAVPVRVAQRHELLPKVVVEPEIEQRTVHVEQDDLDGGPIEARQGDHAEAVGGWRLAGSSRGEPLGSA